MCSLQQRLHYRFASSWMVWVALTKIFVLELLAIYHLLLSFSVCPIHRSCSEDAEIGEASQFITSSTSFTPGPLCTAVGRGRFNSLKLCSTITHNVTFRRVCRILWGWLMSHGSYFRDFCKIKLPTKLNSSKYFAFHQILVVRHLRKFHDAKLAITGQKVRNKKKGGKMNGQKKKSTVFYSF